MLPGFVREVKLFGLAWALGLWTWELHFIGKGARNSRGCHDMGVKPRDSVGRRHEQHVKVVVGSRKTKQRAAGQRYAQVVKWTTWPTGRGPSYEITITYEHVL